MKYFLAHAGEDHASETEGFVHLAKENSLFVVPLVLLIILALAVGIYAISKKSLSAALIVTMALLLLGGMLLYSVLPIVSVACLVSGFALSLFLTINGLKG